MVSQEKGNHLSSRILLRRDQRSLHRPRHRADPLPWPPHSRPQSQCPQSEAEEAAQPHHQRSTWSYYLPGRRQTQTTRRRSRPCSCKCRNRTRCCMFSWHSTARWSHRWGSILRGWSLGWCSRRSIGRSQRRRGWNMRRRLTVVPEERGRGPGRGSWSPWPGRGAGGWSALYDFWFLDRLSGCCFIPWQKYIKANTHQKADLSPYYIPQPLLPNGGETKSPKSWLAHSLGAVFTLAPYPHHLTLR